MKAYSFPKKIVLQNVAGNECCPDPYFQHICGLTLAVDANMKPGRMECRGADGTVLGVIMNIGCAS
jgi:hypothetical protein